VARKLPRPPRLTTGVKQAFLIRKLRKAIEPANRRERQKSEKVGTLRSEKFEFRTKMKAQKSLACAPARRASRLRFLRCARNRRSQATKRDNRAIGKLSRHFFRLSIGVSPLTYRANERLSFNFSEQWNRFRLGLVTDSANAVLPSTAGNFSVVFGSFQTNYSFSRFLTLSTLLQMNTANTQAASANIRLRWNYRPDSDLFVIYTAGQRFASLVATNPPQYYENRLAIKFTYSWRP
jgi:hypothetical protein